MDSIKLDKMRKAAIPLAIVFAVLDVAATVLVFVGVNNVTSAVSSVLLLLATAVMITLFVFAYRISKGTTAPRAFKHIITAYCVQLGVYVLDLIYVFSPTELIGLVIGLLAIVSGVYAIYGFMNLYRSMRHDPNFHKDNYLRIFIWATIATVALNVGLDLILQFLVGYFNIGSAEMIVRYAFIAIILIGDIVSQVMLALYIRNYVPDPSVTPYMDRRDRRSVNRRDGYDGGYGVGGYEEGRGYDTRDPYATTHRETTDDPFDLGGGDSSPSGDSASSSDSPFDDDLFS